MSQWLLHKSSGQSRAMHSTNNSLIAMTCQQIILWEQMFYVVITIISLVCIADVSRLKNC